MDAFKIVTVITTYNTSDYLSDAVNSVLNNAYQNMEIVLVDDGSTDNSVEICQKYLAKDSRIHLITQKNSGVSSARNAGLNQAFTLKADAVHFLDGDDYVTSDFYKNMAETMKKEDADVVSSSFYNEKTSFLDISPAIGHLGLLGRLTVNDGWMKFLFRASLLKAHEDLRFDTHLTYGEDLLFTTKALYYARKAAVAPQALYYYRYNVKSTTKGSMTKEKIENIHRQQILVGELLDSFAQEKEIPSILWERHKQNNWKKQAKYCEDLINISQLKIPLPSHPAPVRAVALHERLFLSCS